MNWMKLHTEARNDAKLRTLTVPQRWVWFCLLCFSSEQKQRGTFPADRLRILAIEVADGDTVLLSETLTALTELDIIAIDGAAGRFIHFDDRQRVHPSDSPAAISERVRKYRERRAEAATAVPTAPSFISACNGNEGNDVTPRYTKDVTRQSRAEEKRSTARTGSTNGSSAVAAVPEWAARAWQSTGGGEQFAAGYDRWVKGLTESDEDKVRRALVKAKTKKPKDLIALARTCFDDPPEPERPPPRPLHEIYGAAITADQMYQNGPTKP